MVYKSIYLCSVLLLSGSVPLCDSVLHSVLCPTGRAWVDTGAQWIHGASEKNPAYCLLKQQGLLGDVVTEGGTELVFHSQGHRVSEDLASSVYEAGESIIRQRHSGSAGKNIGDYYAEESLGLLSKWRNSNEQYILNILSLVGKSLLIDIGAPLLSGVALDSWKYYTPMGDDLNIEGWVESWRRSC